MSVKKIVCKLLCISLISSVAYAVGNVSNEKLYTEIIEKLNFDPKLDPSEITIAIKVGGEVVVLGGTVKNYIEKSIAENAVKEIKGVKAVIDKITVDSSGWRKKKSDDDITQAAIHAFRWHVLIPSEKIKIVVDNGHVTLSGEVDWQFQKNAAWNTVNSLLAVKSVTNNIVVKPSAKLDASKVKANITKEFERHARIDASKINIEIEGKKIILKGVVHNFDEMEYATTTAWSIPGVEKVENELKIGQ